MNLSEIDGVAEIVRKKTQFAQEAPQMTEPAAAMRMKLSKEENRDMMFSRRFAMLAFVALLAGLCIAAVWRG